MRSIRKVQKFGAAVVIAIMVASGMTIFSTPVYASGGGNAAAIAFGCKLIEFAEQALMSAQAAKLPPALVAYLQTRLEALELAYKCGPT
jgi:hypothetical protein